MTDNKHHYHVFYKHSMGYGKCTADSDLPLEYESDLTELTDKIQNNNDVRRVAIVNLIKLKGKQRT